MTDQLFRAGGRVWRGAFWLVCAAAAVLAVLPRPPRLATGAFADKFEHMLAFAVLATLVQIAFPRVSRPWLWLWLAVFGAAIEAAQAIPALHRDSSLADWAVDAAVAALVLAVPAWLARPRTTALAE